MQGGSSADWRRPPWYAAVTPWHNPPPAWGACRAPCIFPRWLAGGGPCRSSCRRCRPAPRRLTHTRRIISSDAGSPPGRSPRRVCAPWRAREDGAPPAVPRESGRIGRLNRPAQGGPQSGSSPGRQTAQVGGPQQPGPSRRRFDRGRAPAVFFRGPLGGSRRRRHNVARVPPYTAPHCMAALSAARHQAVSDCMARGGVGPDGATLYGQGGAAWRGGPLGASESLEPLGGCLVPCAADRLVTC